jgi:hypothetical protein
MIRNSILVTGSRTWADLETMRAWLIPALRRWPRLVEGGASGADDMAAGIAANHEDEFVKPVDVCYRVDHALDGPWPGAGPRRNERMVSAEAPTIARVFAFTVGRALTKGTRDCVERCIAHGLPVFIVTEGARP